jgi:glycosyltransferase involved in cell wall biosynthesis
MTGVGSPLVSCIVPVYNGARFLGETLASILSQTHQPVEVIVVDDGSTDGTAGVIASFGARVRSVRQENAGEAAARNTGVRLASGEYVAFLDADDLWEAPKIERQLAVLARAGTDAVDLSFTAFQNFWMPEVATEQRAAAPASGLPFAAWSICTLLARREVFDRFGPFDESLRKVPNMTWFVRAAASGARMDVLPEPLVRRRVHASNASRQHEALSNDEFLSMLKIWRDYKRGAEAR